MMELGKILVSKISYKPQATSFKLPECAPLLAACSLRLGAVNSIIQNSQLATTRS
jgi:hypothetical protein